MLTPAYWTPAASACETLNARTELASRDLKNMIARNFDLFTERMKTSVEWMLTKEHHVEVYINSKQRATAGGKDRLLHNRNEKAFDGKQLDPVGCCGLYMFPRWGQNPWCMKHYT